jgi:FlaA1/EpsC-like NDP-sugar epimerase
MIIFEKSRILILGATGSWGQELVTQLLPLNPKELRVFSRHELSQVTMKREFNNEKLNFIIGDVRDLESLMNASKNIDYIFHLASLKHIPICEQFPNEAIKTNILGTKNVIEAAIKNKVKKVMNVSSDKAASPLNLYGMTKAIGERLFVNANLQSKDTQFICIRAGNVLGSSGSVVPLFMNQIKQENRMTITDKRMTRYFLTLKEAIKLLFVAMESGKTTGIYVMKMPACYILDLALVLKEVIGNKETKIEETGIRQGEKLHEVLISKYEAPYTYECGKNYYFVSFTKYNKKNILFEEYNSNQNLMDKKQIKEMLLKGKFINE